MVTLETAVRQGIKILERIAERKIKDSTKTPRVWNGRDVIPIEKCVFCDRYSDPQTKQSLHLCYYHNCIFFVCDLVKQSIFNETGFYGCNHEKYSNESINLARFITDVIKDNKNIDPLNPHEFIPLISDFTKMDSAFDYYINKRTDEIKKEISEIIDKPTIDSKTMTEVYDYLNEKKTLLR